nr:MAG TPA: hypothetical protein [Caudoviricetes sp.]
MRSFKLWCALSTFVDIEQNLFRHFVRYYSKRVLTAQE